MFVIITNNFFQRIKYIAYCLRNIHIIDSAENQMCAAAAPFIPQQLNDRFFFLQYPIYILID